MQNKKSPEEIKSGFLKEINDLTESFMLKVKEIVTKVLKNIR